MLITCVPSCIPRFQPAPRGRTARHLRLRRHPRLPAAENPNVNLDIGQSLEVAHWRADGTAEVRYRGAAWQARFVGTGMPAVGRHVIRAVEGSCLLVEPA